MPKEKVKASDLRSKDSKQLIEKLEQLKQELYQLRISKVTGGQASNLLNIKNLRKSIARVYTVLAEKQRNEVKKVFENKKLKPLDIRGRRHTRAYRRRMLPYQLKIKVPSVARREKLFPQRKFALMN